MNLSQKVKDFHFLICEDYESIRTLVADELRACGVENISTAVSGNEGLKLIQLFLETQSPVQFLITDLVMDDGTGIELTRAIRTSSDPRINSLPILMLTSKADMTNVLAGITAGVNNYVVKPWGEDDLIKRINEVCTKLKI